MSSENSIVVIPSAQVGDGPQPADFPMQHTGSVFQAAPAAAAEGTSKNFRILADGSMFITNDPAVPLTVALPADAATETTLSALNLAFAGEDFASETTLAALNAAFGAEDFASEATLAALNAKFVTGTDIGDVTVNNAAGGAAVNIQDGGNSITVDNSGLTKLDGAIAGSEVQVDIVAPLPAGGNTIGAVTIGTLSIVDLIDDLGDGDGIIYVANDNIDDAAGAFLTIVASTAAEIKQIEIRSTAGGFVGLYTGAAAAEVLLTNFGPGEDRAIDVGAIAPGTRLSLRRTDSTTVPLVDGFITMTFLG